MKTITTILHILACLCFTAAAQTTTPDNPVVGALDKITMPTYVGGGAFYDQPNGWKGFVFASTPLSSPKGIYATTLADLSTVKVQDAVTKKDIYVLQTQMEAGFDKTLYTGAKVQFLIGAGAGASFTSLGSGGTAVTIATDMRVTTVVQVSKHFGLLVPIRGTYSGEYGGWKLRPGAGIVWKP